MLINNYIVLMRIFIHQNQPVAKVIKKYLTNNTEKNNQFTVIAKYQCRLLQFLYRTINFSDFLNKYSLGNVNSKNLQQSSITS